MVSELSREIQKLEVRFEDYMKAEHESVELVKECIRTFRELMKGLEKRGETPSSEELKNY